MSGLGTRGSVASAGAPLPDPPPQTAWGRENGGTGRRAMKLSPLREQFARGAALRGARRRMSKRGESDLDLPQGFLGEVASIRAGGGAAACEGFCRSAMTLPIRSPMPVPA